MMQAGVCIERYEGTPQGGPLSPLLANLLLDDLDKEMERRGHCFCRYADDCNIYVRSQAAGERVMASVVAFLEGKLRLKVNRGKSAVAPVLERSFLGHRLLPGGRLGLAPKSLVRAKERLRWITRRNRGIAFERMIAEVNSFTTGWVTYFRHAACKSTLRDLDDWLRRKLRCVRLKQCKRAKAIAEFLMKCGVPARRAWPLAAAGKGWWRRSGSPPANEGHDAAVVCEATRQPPRPSHRAASCWKPPRTMSTLGGVRGGDREESPYSICVTSMIDSLTAWRWESSTQPDDGEGLAKRKGAAARRRLKEAWSKDAARWTGTG
jgi:Reverse transcriptase (RNA-dependent DNA polymerase)/Group II intron, maturase-specific domain